MKNKSFLKNVNKSFLLVWIFIFIIVLTGILCTIGRPIRTSNYKPYLESLPNYHMIIAGDGDVFYAWNRTLIDILPSIFVFIVLSLLLLIVACLPDIKKENKKPNRIKGGKN